MKRPRKKKRISADIEFSTAEVLLFLGIIYAVKKRNANNAEQNENGK